MRGFLFVREARIDVQKRRGAQLRVQIRVVRMTYLRLLF